MNTAGHLVTDIVCLVCFPCSVSPRLQQLEQQEISDAEGGEWVQGGRILKSSPSLSTVGRSNLANGPPYHVNRKEALAKTAWFLCISNISNFIKIFPTMHLRVRN